MRYFWISMQCCCINYCDIFMYWYLLTTLVVPVSAKNFLKIIINPQSDGATTFFKWAIFLSFFAIQAV